MSNQLVTHFGLQPLAALQSDVSGCSFSAHACLIRSPTRVLYTPPPFPTDSDRLSLDPANSNGPSRQSVGLPTDSIGLDQIPLRVRSKSGEVILKQKSVGLAGLASPADFCWTSVGLPMVLNTEKRKNMTSPQSTQLPTV
jgi:hypothetical protein